MTQMVAEPLKGGGWTVDGGGTPGNFRGGRVSEAGKYKCNNCSDGGCEYCQPPKWQAELHAKIDRLEKKAERNGRMLEKIGKMVSELGRQPREGVPPAIPTLAPDSDLDSQYGDELVKKNPPRWKGDSFAGSNMSTCSPEFLDEVASFYDWKAGKDDEKAAAPATTDEEKAEEAKRRKYAGYARKSASRARGWAARLRAGWKPATTNGDDDSWD